MRAVVFSAVLLGACSSSEPPSSLATETGATDPTGALPCAVDDVLARRCRECHSSPTKHGAPMSLVTLADLHDASFSAKDEPVFRRIAARIHDDDQPMPQPPNARLDAHDMGVLDAWIAADAPAGDACTTAPAAADDTPKLSCTPDVHMTPASAYEMPADSDDRYVCYGFDVPIGDKRHVTAIAPKLDNQGIIHHLVLFEAPKSVPNTPGGCDLAAMYKWRLLYGWAPGTGALELPPEAGYPAEGTAHFVVQLHYSNPKKLDGQRDASGFEFCTTSTLRPHDADALVFGDDKFTIPARGALERNCDYTVADGLPDLHVFAALPHMHQIGAAISSNVGGVDLGTRDPWDFNNQIYVPVNATLHPGDVVHTRCAWKNPNDTPVTFGPYTTDEMCYSYTLYWPRIEASGWTWDSPVSHATCR